MLRLSKARSRRFSDSRFEMQESASVLFTVRRRPPKSAVAAAIAPKFAPTPAPSETGELRASDRLWAQHGPTRLYRLHPHQLSVGDLRHAKSRRQESAARSAAKTILRCMSRGETRSNSSGARATTSSMRG